MAAVRSKLVQCLLTSRQLNMKRQVPYCCSVGINFFKDHQFVPLNVSSSRLSALFYSQKASEPSVGHMEKQAALGFKTGGNAYDANRPSYTVESVELIVYEIVSSSEAAKASGLKYDVLELGSGTGKMTEQLSKKLPSQMKYLATEPSENFMSVLKSKGLNVDTAVATADSIPLAENTVGSVVCAQCFHFFPEKKHLESIHRVLVPGGKLILIWNMKQFDDGWMSAFYKQRKEIINKIGGSTKNWVNSMEWRKDIDLSSDFKLLWHKSLPGINFQGDIETIISNLTTSSAYKVLSEDERKANVDELRQGLKDWPGLDLNNITMPYTTELFVYTAADNWTAIALAANICFRPGIQRRRYTLGRLQGAQITSSDGNGHTNVATSKPSIGHIKKQAKLGFETGGDNYDANRPSYTDESVDLIVSEIVSSSAKVSGLRYDVLELGSGTGKLTEHLSKKLPSHMKYLATEPSENFLSVLKSKNLNVDTAIATADSIPVAEKTVGSVVCAQCFHWFSDKENLDSIHKVLIPGGKLILIWNMKQFGHEWMSAFYEQRKEVVKKIDGSMKDLVNSMEWRKDIDVSDNFKLLWHKSLPGINFQGDIEAILLNLTTVSAYNILPTAERDAYVDQLRQVLKTWPGLDLNNITLPYSTELFVFTAQ